MVSKVVRQVASGLAFIHSALWVHRDIKPANLAVQESIVKAAFSQNVGLVEWCCCVTLFCCGLCRVVAWRFSTLATRHQSLWTGWWNFGGPGTTAARRWRLSNAMG